MTDQHTPILETMLSELKSSALLGPILDLACGTGRNGLYLVRNDIPVVFADRNSVALEEIQQQLVYTEQDRQAMESKSTCWDVDFEKEDSYPLRDKRFGGIVVFRYLYRPLMAGIKDAVIPGGLVIYETFNVDQARFGRPKNPDYLLRPGELRTCFEHWEILDSFEGIIDATTGNGQQSISRIIARKPL